MNTLIALGLLALVALLFHRWVERRHKVLLGKLLLGVIGLVAVLGVLVYWGSNRRNARHERLQRSVSIEFVPDSSAVSGSPPTGDTVHQVSFRLCNSGPDTIASVEFSPKTLLRGRSTEHDLVLTNPYRGIITNDLSSDYILPPDRCVTLTWPGEFTVLDTVVPGFTSVERQGGQ